MIKQITLSAILFSSLSQAHNLPEKSLITLKKLCEEHITKNEKAKCDFKKAVIAAGTGIALFFAFRFLNEKTGDSEFMNYSIKALGGTPVKLANFYIFGLTEAGLMGYSLIKSLGCLKHMILPIACKHIENEKKELNSFLLRSN